MSNRTEKANIEKRFIRYIKEKWTNEEIADREGMQPDYAGQERKRIARKHGLKLPGLNREPDRERRIAVGFDADTFVFRQRLANLMENVRQKHDRPAEIAYRTGVPQKHQLWATDHKEPDYNWTLGQLFRVAAENNMTWEDFLKRLTAPNTAMERASAKSAKQR